MQISNAEKNLENQKSSVIISKQMAKIKTDEQLREEIALHSETARDLLGKSHEIHMKALRAEFTTEHIQIMKQVIEFQRIAIRETKKVTRLETVLRNRRLKTMNKECSDTRNPMS